MNNVYVYALITAAIILVITILLIVCIVLITYTGVWAYKLIQTIKEPIEIPTGKPGHMIYEERMKDE